VEQHACIVAADFEAIWVADGGVIEPSARDAHIFERVVHGVQNPIRPDFENHFGEGLRPEVAAGGDVKVFAQLVAHGQLGLGPGGQGAGDAIVDAPHAARQSFAEMPNNYFQFRVVVEQATAHQAQRMDRSLGGKSPDRAGQPRISLIDRLVLGQRRTRVQIERHIQLLNRRPKIAVRRQIVEHQRVHLARLGESIDHGATKS
jgi:hypothetical protein